jgi:RimJ/RimL family protein N-acetyltransferase
MKIIPKKTVETYSLPLPIYKSVHVADGIGKDGSEFDLNVGLEEKQAEQLRRLSADTSDTDLQNFTGDMKRFVEGSYDHWYKKNRSIFALVHKQSGDLAAVIWFGPKPLGKKSIKFGGQDEHTTESDWHTISFRSYPQYRGKGIMKNFSTFAIDTYRSHFPRVKFWTGTDDRNAAFIRLITDLGFTVDEEHSDLPDHWLIMVKM